jgi:hypothetical protein
MALFPHFGRPYNAEVCIRVGRILPLTLLYSEAN